MKSIEEMIIENKRKFLSDILKNIYGTSSVGLKNEFNTEGGIYGKYGSINKERFNGEGNRFYELFRYTFMNKKAKYAIEHQRKRFVRKDIFIKSFTSLKRIFNLPDNLIPVIQYDMDDEKLNCIGDILYQCYSVVLDMLYKDNELDTERYRPKIIMILSSALDNKPDELNVENNWSRVSLIFSSEYEKMDEASKRDYLKRKEAFMKEVSEMEDVNDSDMNWYYKSGSLGNYANIREYTYSKNIEIIDLDSEGVTEFEENRIYRYSCVCFFEYDAIDKDLIITSIELNGENVSALTSKKNWRNVSVYTHYIRNSIPKGCVCYFKYDENRVFQFLQIGDE